MDEMLSSLNNPYILAGIVFLTVVSTVLCWIGWKRKQWGMFLGGIGAGIPTFDMGDWRCWLVGTVVCGLGWWLHVREGTI